MPEPVRVRDTTTGHEYSTYAHDGQGNTDEGLEILDKPAVDERGALLPPTYPEVDDSAADVVVVTDPPAPAPAAAKKAAASPRSNTTTGQTATTEES